MPICKIPEIHMISAKQAGEEVNRDLEVLFETVNRILRCQQSMVKFLNNLTGGTFGDGDHPENGKKLGGGGFGGNEGGGTLSIRGKSSSKPFHVTEFEQGSDWEIPGGFSGLILLNATAPHNVTLPSFPFRGQWILIFNSGSANATVKAGAASVCVVKPNEFAFIPTKVSPSGAISYPDSVPVVGFDGGLFAGTAGARNSTAILQSDSTSKGWLPPRMTMSQRDAIPSVPIGLIIYNTTTDGLEVNTSLGWRRLVVI